MSPSSTTSKGGLEFSCFVAACRATGEKNEEAILGVIRQLPPPARKEAQDRIFSLVQGSNPPSALVGIISRGEEPVTARVLVLTGELGEEPVYVEIVEARKGAGKPKLFEAQARIAKTLEELDLATGKVVIGLNAGHIMYGGMIEAVEDELREYVEKIGKNGRVYLVLESLKEIESPS